MTRSTASACLRPTVLTRISIYVELTSTRLELAVFSGGMRTQARGERYSPPETSTDLAEVLRARHATLSGWVAELGLTGASATLVFTTPTTTCSIVSLPAAVTGAAASQAARLALSDLAGYPTASHPSDTQTLLTDLAPWARPGSSGGNVMSHIVACVEHETTCALLAQWVGSCGLRVERMIPAVAGPIAACVRGLHAIGGEPTPATRAQLWLGEHESFLLVGGPTGLALYRPLGIGVESFVEALLRPIQPRTPGSATVTIDRASARSIMSRHGVPAAGDLVDQRNDITGAGLLPLLSPVLQRLAVEVKQSVRFGLSEKDRAGLGVTLTGPGAAIPRLAEVLSGLCQSPVTVSTTQPAPASGEPGSATDGNIAALSVCTNLELSLLPTQMQGERMARSARRSLRVGLVAALAMVCTYAAWSWLALDSARAQRQGLSAGASSAQEQQEARRASSAAGVATNQASRLIADAVGPSPEWASVLAGLAQTIPTKVTVTSLELNDLEPSGEPVARLAGTMLASDDAAFAADLRSLIAQLESLPAVSGVKMGGTSRSGGSRSDPSTPIALDSFSFDLSVTLVNLPYAYVAPGAFEPPQAVAPAPSTDKPLAGQPDGVSP